MPSAKILSTEDLIILIGTWNVNGKFEEPNNLSTWLNISINPKPPDFVAIGLQEMIELSATNIVTSTVLDSLSQDASHKWNKSIETFLNESFLSNTESCHDEYYMVESGLLVGINLTVFAKCSLRPFITGVQSAVVPRGVRGLGNKGAVCIRLQVYNTKVCFVCSHLTAHQHLTMKRNEDVDVILTEKIFREKCKPIDSSTDKLNLLSSNSNISSENQRGIKVLRRKLSKTEKSLSYSGRHTSFRSNSVISETDPLTFPVNEHDVIIWFGDLNYRLETGPSLSETYEMIEANALSYLLQTDQLNIEREAGRVFVGFQEGYIRFPPTYQCIPGVGCYDDRADGKLRTPAWCDRILWRTYSESSSQYFTGSHDQLPSISSSDIPPVLEKIECLSYSTSNFNIISDHKPVSALLKLAAKRCVFIPSPVIAK